MKKYLYLVPLVLVMAACGDAAKLQYARKLMNEKSYAAAADVARTASDNNDERNKLLAEASFKLLDMTTAAEAYGKCSVADLTDEQKMQYCEALKQTGNAKRCIDVAATSMNALWAKEYMKANTFTPDTQVKIEPLEFNSPSDEQTAFFYNSNLYYLSNGVGTKLPTERFKWNNTPFLEITGGAGKNELEKLNTKFHDGPVAVNDAKGLIVYNRSTLGKSKSKPPRITLYQTTLGSLDASKAKEINICVGTTSFMHPAWNTSGKSLAFASNSGEGKGGMDLYTAALNDDNSYASPMALAILNSAYEEVYPSFLTDSLIIFASNRPSGMGGLDLYSSNLQKDGTWTAPWPLPAPINSVRDDFYLVSESTGSNTYLFTSNREGSDDIFRATVDKNAAGRWEIELIDEVSQKTLGVTKVSLRYENSEVASVDTLTSDVGAVMADGKGKLLNVAAEGYMAAEANYTPSTHGYFGITRQSVAVNSVAIADVKGKIVNEVTGEALAGATVIIHTKNGTDTLSTDAIGAFIYSLNVKDNPKISIDIAKTGFLPKNIGGIPLTIQSTQIDLNSMADLSLKGVKVGDDLGSLLDLNPIYFETARAEITSQGAAELDKIALFMVRNGSLTIECGSHTDCRGSAESNKALSEARANSTAQFLIKKGIERSRIKFKGYGEASPVNDCNCDAAPCNEEAMAENRRTEFRVLASAGNIIAQTKHSSRVAAAGVSTSGNAEEVVNNDVKYNEASPIPRNANLPDGIVYSVQVGAYSVQADETYFNGLSQLRKEVGNDYTRYYVGVYKLYREAEAAMQEVRKVGISDAFVVAYKNGVRVPLQSAQKEKSE